MDSALLIFESILSGFLMLPNIKDNLENKWLLHTNKDQYLLLWEEKGMIIMEIILGRGEEGAFQDFLFLNV